MASYHLSVKTVKRSVGRSATAAAAYRAGERIACDREGRVYDYTRKQGIAGSFILAPVDAPDWAQDRAALWNAAEARESRRNAVVAREWELALPAELDEAGRRDLARAFAEALVARYGVAADVALHAPHREGDQRNHHAHILTTTREIGAGGLGAKTRILDAAKTGGAEIEAMRGFWAELQNRALERQGDAARVDHRSLADQRKAALAQGEELAAAELDRAPEIKLGPAASSLERKAMRTAEAEGVEYIPVTDRGAQNHALRQRRDLLAALRQRAEAAREAWSAARAREAGRLDAAIDAAKALFTGSGAAAFAREFNTAWQVQEDARQREIEAERERLRQEQLAVERARFIEDTAQRWEATRQLDDQDAARAEQGRLVDEATRAAGRFGVSFKELADPINARANQIQDEYREQERQRQAERERAEAQRARTRSSGSDYGL